MIQRKTQRKPKVDDLTKSSHYGCLHNCNFVAPGRSANGEKTDATLRLMSNSFVLSRDNCTQIGKELAKWLEHNLPFALFMELKNEIQKL